MSVLVTLLLDRLLGEPPDRAHPAVHRDGDTADACWGHRDDRWRHAGWAVARAAVAAIRELHIDQGHRPCLR